MRELRVEDIRRMREHLSFLMGEKVRGCFFFLTNPTKYIIKISKLFKLVK